MLDDEGINYTPPNIDEILDQENKSYPNDQQNKTSPNEDNSNLLLTELKAEDMELEREENNIQNFENSIFDIRFNKILDNPYPTTSNEDKVECFSLQFEKFDTLLAAGYSNGSVSVFNIETGTHKDMKCGEFPVTSIRWKPHAENKPKNILLSVTADGRITLWHTASGKALHTMVEKDNPIMCLDYSRDGQLFATAGNDKLVRIYDDNTKTLLKIMKPGSFDQPGHSNRIFSVNFHKENQNLLASGGWDNTVQFYDLREGTIINSIYGPHICGDSIDMKGNYLLTGSWSVKDQLQLWDLRMFKVSKNIPWQDDELFYPTYIYTAEFSKNSLKGDMICVGGSNNNIVRVFEDETEKKMPQAFSKNLASPVYSIDFSHNGNLLAYGSGDGKIRLLHTAKKGLI
jgi:COMPASS component SWD3